MVTETLNDSSTLLCGGCIARRGLVLPADPVWTDGTCDICQTATLVASPLLFVHHTLGEPPLDCGGNDGIG